MIADQRISTLNDAVRFAVHSAIDSGANPNAIAGTLITAVCSHAASAVFADRGPDECKRLAVELRDRIGATILRFVADANAGGT